MELAYAEAVLQRFAPCGKCVPILRRVNGRAPGLMPLSYDGPTRPELGWIEDRPFKPPSP